MEGVPNKQVCSLIPEIKATAENQEGIWYAGWPHWEDKEGKPVFWNPRKLRRYVGKQKEGQHSGAALVKLWSGWPLPQSCSHRVLFLLRQSGGSFHQHPGHYLTELWCWKQGGGLFPVESLSWLRVSVCLLTGWPPAKLNCPWKICSNYWRLQGTITEIWKYGTLKTGGEPLVESTFELLLPWCLYPLRGLNNYHNPPIGTIEQVDIWPKEDTDNEARDATLHLLLVTHWAYAGPRSIAHSKKLSRSHVIQS